MPMVFWDASVEGWHGNPRIAEGMEAEVTLPNGQKVVVDEVRYQGTSAGSHHWHGRLSINGKPLARHTVFNCEVCGTVKCQLKEKKMLEAQ